MLIGTALAFLLSAALWLSYQRTKPQQLEQPINISYRCPTPTYPELAPHRSLVINAAFPAETVADGER